MDQNEVYLPWHPFSSLPDWPLGQLELVWDGDSLVVTAFFGFESPPFERIKINFGWVQAFKIYEEFSDPWMQEMPDQPKNGAGAYEGRAWPFQEVRGSAWVERVLARNGGIDGFPWKHWIIVTGDTTLHVMSVEEPRLVEMA